MININIVKYRNLKIFTKEHLILWNNNAYKKMQKIIIIDPIIYYKIVFVDFS